MSDATAHELPLVASQFIVQVACEGANLVVGQGVVGPSQDEAGKLKPEFGISWHTQLFLSPVSMKKLAEILTSSVADYEKKFGPVATSAKDE